MHDSCLHFIESSASRTADEVTLTAESTTAQFACCRRGVTRSTMLSASLLSRGLYQAKLSKMNTCTAKQIHVRYC